LSLLFVPHLGEQALTGLSPKSQSETVIFGPVKLVKCFEAVGGCGLVQLRQSHNTDDMYADNYGYRSGLNQSMVGHLQHRAQTAMATENPAGGQSDPGYRQQ
jgi:hypothetical protein